MSINIKRIYEPAAKTDGYRILVDRLWPRGIKKEAIDMWLKDAAPSTPLRKWFNHEPEKWEKFRQKYHAELNASPVLKELKAIIHKHPTITLLFAAVDREHNHALVLQQFISEPL